jgi:uncharacterized protein (TIGR01777 family)
MRVLLAGGSGMRGRALAIALHSNGHDVSILSRNPGKHRSSFPAPIRLVQWGGPTSVRWTEEIDRADAIVNLAGENLGAKRWSPARKREILDSRVLPGAALVKAIEDSKKMPRVFLQAAGVGYYGPRGEETLTEDSKPGMDFQCQVCIEWENSTIALEKMGIRRVITRNGVVLKKEGGALPRMALPFRFFVGGPVGNGRQWFPWIHHADDVRVIMFLIEHELARGVFNLTAPQPVRNRDFARVLGNVLKRPAFVPVPALALRLLFGEMSTVLLDGQKALPTRLQEAGFAFRFPDLESALGDIYS